MELPKWLWTLILVLVILGFVGLGLRLFSGYQILGDIANFALILTLAAVLVYVYYTYLLAKDAWTPSASFALEAYPDDPYHFAFLIWNHSKVSLNCWCNLNAAVYGQVVSLRGFYGGQSSFDLQPFGRANGHFHIKDILARANRNLQEMQQSAGVSNPKGQLYLNIEFWYRPVGGNIVIRNPRQPYYFDFQREIMVADF